MSTPGTLCRHDCGQYGSLHDDVWHSDPTTISPAALAAEIILALDATPSAAPAELESEWIS